MKSSGKILLIVVLLWILSTILIVFHYEKKLKVDENDVTVIGGRERNKHYTAVEIITLIKQSPEYRGDSLIIYKDGKIGTNNSKFQGTIDAVDANDKPSLDQQVIDNDLPRQLLLYKMAARYYRLQYADEFKSDSLKK